MGWRKRNAAKGSSMVIAVKVYVELILVHKIFEDDATPITSHTHKALEWV